MENNVKPVKTIAGEVLIYLYNRQRKEAFTLKYLTAFFQSTSDKVELTNTGEFERVLLRAANGSSSDAYNALDYLSQCGFIEYSEDPDIGGNVHIINFHVRSAGVDIIEGIERDTDARHNFNVTFNFKLADNVNIDSLVKNEIETLLKASVL